MSLWSPPEKRQRFSSMPVVAGGDISSFLPQPNPPSAEEFVQASATQGFYHFHQGDLFLPGPAAFAMDPPYETQLYTQWGHGFLIAPNRWPPIAFGQVAVAHPLQPLIGVGGQVHGQMVFQPAIMRGVE